MLINHRVAAVVFAAAIASAGVGYPWGARAEPVWDIEEYDYCMKQTTDNVPSSDPVAQFEEAERYCCNRSGGVHNGATCVAPAVQGGTAILPGGPRVGLPTVAVKPSDVAPPPMPPPRADLPTIPILPPIG